MKEKQSRLKFVKRCQLLLLLLGFFPPPGACLYRCHPSYFSEYSMQLNASRIKVLQVQDDIVNTMKESANNGLLLVSDDPKAYKKLLQGLIVQSLLRLKEPSVLLRCREVDLKLVESVLEDSKQEYAQKAKVAAPKIIVDSVYLPPPPSRAESHGPSCSGGVVLASPDGKIVFENTLDARLDVAFRQKLPEIRKRLLGGELSA